MYTSENYIKAEVHGIPNYSLDILVVTGNVELPPMLGYRFYGPSLSTQTTQEEVINNGINQIEKFTII